MIRRAELDGVVVHDLSLTNPVLQLGRDRVTGLGEPIFRVSSSDRSGEDGGTVSSVLLGMRPVSLGGKVSGSDSASFMVNRRLLQQACATNRDSTGRPLAKRLYLTTLDNVEYFIDVYVQSLNVATEYNSMADFLIQLLAADPAIFVNDPQISGQVARPSGGGVSSPLVYDPTIEYGATTGGSLVLSNYGNAASWPILRFRGPALNPTVVNQTLDRVIALNVRLAAGETVVINMKERTITLNGTTNYLPFKTAESQWFSVQPGDNVYSFSTGDSSDTGTMELEYYPAMLGL
jgi:hypothetical protein